MERVKSLQCTGEEYVESTGKRSYLSTFSLDVCRRSRYHLEPLAVARRRGVLAVGAYQREPWETTLARLLIAYSAVGHFGAIAETRQSRRSDVQQRSNEFKSGTKSIQWAPHYEFKVVKQNCMDRQLTRFKINPSLGVYALTSGGLYNENPWRADSERLSAMKPRHNPLI